MTASAAQAPGLRPQTSSGIFASAQSVGGRMLPVIVGVPGAVGAHAAVPVDPHLRPVGLDHVGAGDPPPRPGHRGRAVVEAAARALHHAVLPLRRGGRADAVAVDRPRGGAAVAGDGLPPRPPPDRRGPGPAGSAACAPRCSCSRPTSSCATRCSATRRPCSPRWRCGRSSAISTGGATTRSTSASPRRCCGPRRGRSSASTGCGCGSATPSCACASPSIGVAVPVLWFGPSCGARASRCGRPAGRTTPTRAARRSPTTPASRWSAASPQRTVIPLFLPPPLAAVSAPRAPGCATAARAPRSPSPASASPGSRWWR